MVNLAGQYQTGTLSNIVLPSEISLGLFMTDLILDLEIRSDRMGIVNQLSQYLKIPSIGLLVNYELAGIAQAQALNEGFLFSLVPSSKFWDLYSQVCLQRENNSVAPQEEP